ncbi:MAG TPA: hypothetical protein DCM26_01720 [Desulfotomaculum sp.]|nr:hypothetical protein [Desulfotomaculum sp.]
MTTPSGKILHPSKGRCWALSKATFESYRAQGRIWFGKGGDSQPNVIRYLSEVEGMVPWTWWPHEEVGHTDESKKEIYAILGQDIDFATPKPSRLIERILQIATKPGDIVLDSFAGSGTTGHAVLNLNKANADKSPRQFVLVELEPKISKAITAERVRRVAHGYTTPKGEAIEGLGGGFRYCELGEPLFEEGGHIRATVSFADLARHVYFTETGEPLPRERISKTPLLGIFRGVAVYLLYNGILGDKTVNGGNVLTRSILAKLPPFKGQKIIYCAGCLLGHDRLHTEKIIIRQTPYEIKVS